MILEATLLVVIILNLALMGFLAFLGKKNSLLVAAIVEALLAIGFALLVT
ncbi:MAG: hypothetical protein AABX13_03285 [Nanoarchaeota archaeon]